MAPLSFDLAETKQLVLDQNSMHHFPKWPGFSFPTLIFDPSREFPYRLYFGSHSSKELLVALAKSIDGPFEVQPRPVMNLRKVLGAKGHLGSPEVQLLENGEYRLYFHANTWSRRQLTFSARSDDGLKFKVISSLGRKLPFYARLFRVRDQEFALTKGGDIYAKGNFGSWSPVNNPFVGDSQFGTPHNYVGAVRHAAILNLQDEIFVFFTKIGDAPERILCTKLTWVGFGTAITFFAGEVHEVIATNQDWEGLGIPISPSRHGGSSFEEHALRDPYAYLDPKSDCIHLFYAAGGEGRLGKAVFKVSDFISLMSSQASKRKIGELPLVCVLGFSHAGTTLMYRMLSRSPGSGTFPFETRQFILGTSPMFAKLLVDKGRYIHPPRVIIEKTPRHSLRIDKICDLIPETRFVFMVRDVRDLAGSLLARYRNWRAVLEHLDEGVRSFSSFGSLQNVMVVKYEELVANPESVLKKVAKHTGLSWGPEMLEFHKLDQPWQGHKISTQQIGTMPSSADNRRRRAYQMTQPLYSATVDGRRLLNARQLKSIEKRYYEYLVRTQYL